jgi:PIN domain nuclease of toxin-antitoxin system
MKYLLDTHAIIWYFEASPELPKKIRDIIHNDETGIYISSVSLWEIAIKINLGKLNLKLQLYQCKFHDIREKIFCLQPFNLAFKTSDDGIIHKLLRWRRIFVMCG